MTQATRTTPGASPAQAGTAVRPVTGDERLEWARRLHRQGVEATSGGRPVAGATYLRRGLRALDADTAVGTAAAAAVARQRGRLLISLALAEAEQGHTERGFALLEEARALLPPAEQGVLLQQSGLLMLRLGRVDDALEVMDAAVPLLEQSGEVAVLAPTLLNRALVHIDAGRVTSARADLRRCARLAERHGLELIAGKAVHNGGLCDLLTGDIPSALGAFDAAGRVYAALSPGFLPILTVNRAKALLAAGLARDAARELDEALAQFRVQRLTQDYAEAALARAQAALATDDLPGARTWSQHAERRFRNRGNEAWARLAGVMRIRIELAMGGTPRLPSRALQLAQWLRQHRLEHDADVATLLAVRGLVQAGRPDRARRIATQVPRPRAGAPLETRLLWRMARAELCQASGRPAQALSELRSGLALLHGRRSRLGSLDLQVGAAALGVELARAGLEAAWESGSPELLFAWSERSRAQAFRVRPVRPPADQQTAEALAELRQLRLLTREAELAGRREPRLSARCTVLERTILERGRRVPGTGETSGAFTVPALAAELVATQRVLVTILARRRQLSALVIRDGRLTAVRLGSQAVAEEAQRRLLGDLDALAGRRLRQRLADAIRASIRHQVDVLTAELLAPLRPFLDVEDIVMVPPMSLSAVPWALLPALRGQAVTTAPSAASWLAARRAGTATAAGAARKSTVLVAGPGPAHAEPEVEVIGAVWPGSRTLGSDDATVPAVLDALNTAQLAHIAAHGHHQRENVLFSRLDLADGPLMADDVYGLTSPPAHVVLSACDVGRAAVHPGEEILGFTAALLLAGTRTVVSNVVRVPDETAVEVMSAYHRQVSAGLEPARALAIASLADPLASFVCFGAG